MATASHQSIRDVQDAFNAGMITVHFTIDFGIEEVQIGDVAGEAKNYRMSQEPRPEIEVEITAREQTRGDYVPKVIVTTKEGGKTVKTTL